MRDGSGRQFPLHKIFIKNSIGEKSFCAEMVEAVEELFFVAHRAFAILCACFLQGMALTLPLAGVNEEAF